MKMPVAPTPRVQTAKVHSGVSVIKASVETLTGSVTVRWTHVTHKLVLAERHENEMRIRRKNKQTYKKTNKQTNKQTSSGKTRKHFARNICCGHMFPRCFPVLPYEKHCFSSKICFCFTAEILLHTEAMFPVWKTGKHRGNVCPEQTFLATCFLVLPGLNSRFFCFKRTVVLSLAEISKLASVLSFRARGG